MNEYRCSRNAPYTNPKCFGFTDLQARQGYYIKATSEQDAIAQMELLYPSDDAGFTADLWKVECFVCRGSGKQIPLTRWLNGRVSKGEPISCHLCLGVGQVEITTLSDYKDYIGSI